MRLFLIPLLLVPASVSAAQLSFSRDVQPILSNKCYFCHGPDAAKREAGLRLDTAQGATGPLQDSPGQAIVPGNPAASMAIRRVRSDDPETIMPPPDSHLRLEPAEISTLERWIAEGAVYETHWAFSPLPEKIRLPAISSATPARNEIDHFVVSRLEKEGMSPSRPADPWRLLRRLSFGLTGLPPSPEDIAAFDPNAIEAAVDRLLASPHFGETMALQWLDAARYADSYGYQSDQLMPQWPWRDWVIRAFNDNLPYDDFVTWQLAGDLLPDATTDQILATAFNRLHRMTQEGGTIHEEFRIEGVADRVHTFGTAFLGLTLECARCHDHKYDPITSRDYYSIGAFFNSIPERGVYGHQEIVPGPALLLPTKLQQEQMKQAAAAIAAAEAELAAATMAPLPDGWQETYEPFSGRVAGFDFEADDDSTSPVKAHLGPLQRVDGPRGKAVRFDGDNGVAIPGVFEYDWPQPWTVDLQLKPSGETRQPVVIWHRSFGTDAGYNGIECLLAGDSIEARIVRDWPGSAVGRTTAPAITEGQWHRVTITWDGSGNASGLAIHIDGKTPPSRVTADNLRQTITTRSYGEGTFTLGARFRDRGFANGEIASLTLFDRVLTPLEISELIEPGVIAATRKRGDDSLETAFRAASASAAALQKLAAARQLLVDLESAVQTVAVMRELPEPRPTWILTRGVYDAPRTSENEVARTTFSNVLPPFEPGYPKNRLGLAQWLTHPDHPLAARVFVNRVWQHFFGTGLVATSDNFGFQGSPPTHPELLDWLARDFVSNGWDVKLLCRTIVLSATYQQDSTLTPALREMDPQNLLLARGPSHRLAAEPIRDLALAASGSLVTRVGGPPVSPYQPGEDLWREANTMSPAYRQSTGSDLFRRSIYSVWKRTAPLPNALLFDAPGRETCVVSRSSTNTPLQALVLLNDPQFVEPSRLLAESVMRHHPDDLAAQITSAFTRLTARAPDATELQILTRAHEDQLTLFQNKPDDTRGFLATGSAPPDPALDPAGLAAATVVCQIILNLDAAIWNR